MKKALVILCAASMFVALPNLDATAQMGGQPMTPPGTPQQPAPGQPPAMGGGMMGHQGMTGMMCPMMMGGGMMGGGMGMTPMMREMMAGGRMDPKVMGRMLQLRGDMLKAMGDVLLKHGKLLEEGK
ncbi:MAG: hypothetical protein HYV62_07615 [Candidatus Rokubacteria bacterium]|nr:hypothetical protein [Candidatus Rokubacteria bacterium]